MNSELQKLSILKTLVNKNVIKHEASHIFLLWTSQTQKTTFDYTYNNNFMFILFTCPYKYNLQVKRFIKL